MSSLSQLRRADASPGLVLVVTCAAAGSLGQLVAFRVVQAAGAALLTPTSLSLVLATSAPEKRQSNVRVWTAIGGAAAALGPVVGGLLVAIDWRWVFLVNVPIGLAALVVGWRRLPRVPGHPVPHPDVLGASLAVVGVAALTLGLVKGHDWGWASVSTVAALVVAVAALGAFLAHTLRHHNPLVDPQLFAGRPLRGASVAMRVFSLAFGAMLLSIILWCQNAWGWSALKTGLAVAPGPLMVPLFGLLISGGLIARFGPGPVVGAGATLFAAGFAWWALAIDVRPDYVGEMLGGMVLSGIGVGLTLPTLMATAAGSLRAQAFATGSAVVSTLRQVGLAIGVAILVALLGTHPDLASFHRSWWVLAALGLLTAAVALGLMPERRVAPAAAPTAG